MTIPQYGYIIHPLTMAHLVPSNRTKHLKCMAPIHQIIGGYYYHWIGLRENLQESPIFNGKIYGFL